MSNIEKITKDFTGTLKEQIGNFNNWVAASTVIINAKDNFNKIYNAIKEVDDSVANLKKNNVKSVNTFEIDLLKEEIDISGWEDGIKPVKAIMSIMTKGNGENISIEIGNTVMLMEDGTFRINQ